MSTIRSKTSVPFTYKEKTASGADVSKNIKVYTVFDTELKQTFVYEDGNTLNSGGKPLATIGTNQKVVPYSEGGNFTATDGLRTELGNNTQLSSSLNNITRFAVGQSIGQNPTQTQIDQVMGTNAAASTAANPTPPAQGSTPDAKNIQINDDVVKDANNVRLQYPNVVYPLGLDGFGQDYVKFSMYRYKPKGLSSTDVLNQGITKADATNLGSGKGSVCIAIQSPAGDSNTVGWSDGSMSGIDAAMFNIAHTAIKDGITAGADQAGQTLNSIVQGSYGKPLGYYFAQQAAQINGAFSRATGSILNPNLELLFQAPQLRSFNFTFKLSAREKDEANNIRKIIRFFKQGMSVKKADPQLFLKSPDIFKINYINGSKGDHKSLNRFKTCALQAFNVDYTPLGSYMTFSDEAATMVAYTITMQFQEIDPIYDDDYKFADDEIGY